ncbi:uncharacterized protein LOC128883521 isoform X2 [Hylaeus volcanicus]|uniref:uncharacterized protein LOC128883521 isoform X2 n=1 Tax=Hylaeus volcanicus TaxID=313075 RepID=UPI0023B77FC7|nr:uncharacterized protein LOC128883521 isoform X2 [Hylaeus volcanicus]
MSAIPQILKPGSHEDRGELARLQYFVGAISVGDLIKSTLGPKGNDKILQPLGGEGSTSGKTTITNDGATILKSLWIDNPAAKILVDVSKKQDSQCGDGTTGVVVLAAELLRNAETLINQKIHPQVICSGYRMALDVACDTLKKYCIKYTKADHEFKEALLNVARTTLSSKLLTHEKEKFAELAVSAVLRLNGKPNLDYVKIIKKEGGTLRDSFLEPGFILEKSIGVGQPKTLTNCKILIANTPMDTDKIKIYGARVKVDSFEAVKEIEDAERRKMSEKVEKIAAHGCNVFINRQLIYNYPDQLFKDKGIMAIEHADFEGAEQLAAVLGGEIASTFDNPEKTVLGFCEKIDEVTVGSSKAIRFSGCKKNEACTIILRGANTHILDEAERSLHDALATLSQVVIDNTVVCGAGAAEMVMANAIDDLARSVEGKQHY